jgi:hypothetical protein
MEFTPREAMLKPEFADRYPPLEPGVWETAAELGAKVLLWQVQQQGTDALSSRILDERHFEFRGGGTGARRRCSAHGRATRRITGRLEGRAVRRSGGQAAGRAGGPCGDSRTPPAQF